MRTSHDTTPPPQGAHGGQGDIAIFGGTFDPIHHGHIALARYVVAHGLAEKVWLMPSPLNPLKAGRSMLPESTRLRLARMAVESLPHVKVSDFELHLPRPTYTWRTMAHLRSEFPTRRFSLLIGSDNWLSFDRWARPEEILCHHRLLVYPRPGYPLDESEERAGVTFLHDAPQCPFSSTTLRAALKTGQDCTAMLPRAVYQAIREEGLYSD